MGVASCFLGFFFGTVAGILIFGAIGAIGAILGWFAAPDVEDTIASRDAKHLQVKSRLFHISCISSRGIYLMFGLIVIIVSKLLGVLKK